MTKVKNGKVEGGLNGGGDAEFYVFAVPDGNAAPLLEHVIYKAANEQTARGLCVLFEKRPTSAPGGTSFRHLSALTFGAEDQIVMDEVLDCLDGYGHPDPTVYAVRPSVEVLWRAQCAARARKWDRRLREKLQAQGLWLGAMVEDARAAGRAFGEEEKVNDALQVLMTFAEARSKASSRAAKPAQPAADASAADGRLRIGRLSYLPGFNQVWLGEELFDLSHRPKARACVRYLVENRAYDAAHARHLETEIDPYVRAQCQLPKLGAYSELRMHHYFNPSTSDVARLGRELIQPAGRNGRYFLKVK